MREFNKFKRRVFRRNPRVIYYYWKARLRRGSR